jgi:hypothetical protein
MPVTLDALSVCEEALWDDKMQIVLGAGHRDIKHSALLLELGRVPSQGQRECSRQRRSTRRPISTPAPWPSVDRIR